MLSSEDLRFIDNSKGALCQRSKVILNDLRQYFVRQASNSETRLMIRFRDKGGVQGSVRQSSNTSVLDVFCARSTKEEIIRVLKELEFDVTFVECPYSLYLVSWEKQEIPEQPEHPEQPKFLGILDQGATLIPFRVHKCDTSDGSFDVYLPDYHEDTWIIVEDNQNSFKKNPLRILTQESKVLNKGEFNLDMNSVSIRFTYDADLKQWTPDLKNIKLVKTED